MLGCGVSEIVQFRSRELMVDDACIARAAAAGVSGVEQRLWEAGFSREAAKEAADSIAKPVDNQS